MRIETKAQLSDFTLRTLCLAATLFIIGVMVLVICVGLGINPFRQTTTGFLIAFFIGLIGVAAICVLLNVAANLSLIADSKVAGVLGSKPVGFPLRWVITLGALGLLISGFLGAATYYSKEKYLAIVKTQANTVVEENKDIVEEIARLVKKSDREAYLAAASRIKFLQSQRKDLPSVTVIFSKDFGGKQSLRHVEAYSSLSNSEKELPFYACDQQIDCAYLKQFFDGKTVEPLADYTVADDTFYIYLPLVIDGTRLVLLFDKRNSYGKVGSY